MKLPITNALEFCIRLGRALLPMCNKSGHEKVNREMPALLLAASTGC